jgi:hypothetical protein
VGAGPAPVVRRWQQEGYPPASDNTRRTDILTRPRHPAGSARPGRHHGHIIASSMISFLAWQPSRPGQPSRLPEACPGKYPSSFGTLMQQRQADDDPSLVGGGGRSEVRGKAFAAVGRAQRQSIMFIGEAGPGGVAAFDISEAASTVRHHRGYFAAARSRRSLSHGCPVWPVPGVGRTGRPAMIVGRYPRITR